MKHGHGFNCSRKKSCMIKLFSAVSLSVIQWFNFICIFSLDYQNIIVLEMTGNYRIHFLPKKVDLTPNCATLIKMDSSKIQEKISKLTKSQNYIKKGLFSNETAQIIAYDCLQKRKALDRMSNRIRDQKKKRQLQVSDLEKNKLKWNNFLVS